MKPTILLLALFAVAFSSCNTAYKTAQTPDDVYFSPAKPQDEYVRADNNNQQSDYYNADDYYENRFIRMRAANPYQWSNLDDYYFSDPYAYNYYGEYSSWNSPWNSYWLWNSFYNPYYSSSCYIGGYYLKNPVAYRPLSRAYVFNPNSYVSRNTQRIARPGTYNYYNNVNNRNGRTSSSQYNNGNYNRNSNSNNNNYTPTRSYTPSSSSSGGGGTHTSSGGGGGGGGRPPR